jgi:hypothetical protein
LAVIEIGRECSLRSGQIRGEKGLGYFEKSLEMPHYGFAREKKYSPALS